LPHARFSPWLTFAALAAAVAALLWGIDSYRHRFVRSDRDLFRFLPERDATVFYLNVAALRHTGVLRTLAGASRIEEAEYRAFVQETGLDYTKDIDAIAGAVVHSRIFFTVRGRFDWDKLRAYAVSHGGECNGPICETPASKAGRWASFIQIQPGAIGLAVSAERGAARALRRPRHAFEEPLPGQPIWARISSSALKNPADLPIALRIFAIALQVADPVVLSLAPGQGDDFKLELNAQCANPAMAAAIRDQLTLDTKMLTLELARERMQSNVADLSGLLTAGSFQAIDNRVMGTWPVHKELLKALE
jgi:hypothetical protein